MSSIKIEEDKDGIIILTLRLLPPTGSIYLRKPKRFNRDETLELIQMLIGKIAPTLEKAKVALD